ANSIEAEKSQKPASLSRILGYSSTLRVLLSIIGDYTSDDGQPRRRYETKKQNRHHYRWNIGNRESHSASFCGRGSGCCPHRQTRRVGESCRSGMQTKGSPMRFRRDRSLKARRLSESRR